MLTREWTASTGTGRLGSGPHRCAGNPTQAASLLQQELPRFEAAGFGNFIRALQAIVGGSRDRSLPDAQELDYSMASEILFLIEKLEKAGR